MASMKMMFVTVGALVNAALFCAVEWQLETGQTLMWLIAWAFGGVGWLIRSTAFELGETQAPEKRISRHVLTSCFLGMVCGGPTSWLIAYWTGLVWSPMLVVTSATAWGAGGLHFFVLYGPALMDIVGAGSKKKLRVMVGVDETEPDDDSTKRNLREIVQRLRSDDAKGNEPAK